ncbi:hypothetical protein [Xanthomonas hortorum]|uniref:hypothetical protein n=1 Tax=Xanthomonas hortorum TaxID=56454 RepID=UPI002D7E8DA2|nr:hypothetical protein [Xanthomonas hortorum]
MIDKELASNRSAALGNRKTMTRLRSLALLVSLTLAAVLSSSCARSSEEIAGDARGVRSVAAKSPASHATSKTVTNGVNTPTTSISNQELEARLLQFADAFKVPEDMSYTRLESALGMKLGPASEPASPWHVVKDVALADGYTFYATHFPAKKGFSSMEVAVALPNPIDPTRTPTSVCIWDAAALSQKLEAMGYKRGGQRPFQAGWLRQHWRSIDNGKQGFSVALLIYRTSQESGSRECAFGVQIDGGDV